LPPRLSFSWLCIHSHGASDWHNRDTGHNGHYEGGSQIHSGEGGDGMLCTVASVTRSQSVQNTARKTGYKASGYSRSWLMGQWYHPDCFGAVGIETGAAVGD